MRGFAPTLPLVATPQAGDVSARPRATAEVAVRKWVLSLPYELRGLLAAKAPVLSCVLRLFLRMVTAWYERAAKQAGLASAKTGAIAFPQRFGGSLNLNVHFHVVFLDGVFAKDNDGKLAFHPLQAPSQTEIATLVADIGRRVKNLLRRRGLLRNKPVDADNQD